VRGPLGGLFALRDTPHGTLDHGDSFLNTLKDGAAAIASAVGTLQEVGYAAAGQADPFTCRPA
jgi:hypothetical protein